MEKELKFALLIDAENISPQYVNIILSEANNMGNVIYKRIYGNWTSSQMGSWKSVILDNAIQPIQQYSNTSGKNSSDSALIIDTMDLLYRTQLDGFCIVSSDSDFTRLASRLRESDKYVLGMGESKTPRSFISACNKFLYLDVLYAESKEEDSANSGTEGTGSQGDTTPCGAAAGKASRNDSDSNGDNNGNGRGNGKNVRAIRRALIKLTEENSNDNGWIHSGLLGSLIIRQFPDFDVRVFGYKKFFQFIKSLNLFEIHSTSDPKNKTSKTYYFKLKGNHKTE
ncbi:MAG: HTH OST-type domain-containing protein [Succiniclasticum sp.]|jgi:uncharacterized LabA/DUF88 family protein